MPCMLPKVTGYIKPTYLIHACECGDHLVAVALVHQEPLPLNGVVHLHGILRHQGVEERIVLLRCSS